MKNTDVVLATYFVVKVIQELEEHKTDGKTLDEVIDIFKKELFTGKEGE